MDVQFQKRRALLTADPTCNFVHAKTFLELAVSWKPLDRCDDTMAAVHGLRDRATGTKYVILTEDLVRITIHGGLS